MQPDDGADQSCSVPVSVEPRVGLICSLVCMKWKIQWFARRQQRVTDRQRDLLQTTNSMLKGKLLHVCLSGSPSQLFQLQFKTHLSRPNQLKSNWFSFSSTGGRYNHAYRQPQGPLQFRPGVKRATPAAAFSEQEGPQKQFPGQSVKRGT